MHTSSSLAQEPQSFKRIARATWASLRLVVRWQKGNFFLFVIVETIAVALTYLQLNSFANIIDEVVAIAGNNTGVTTRLVNESLILIGTFLAPAIVANISDFLSMKMHTIVMSKIVLHTMQAFSRLDVQTVEGSQFQKDLEFARQRGVGSIWGVVRDSINIYRHGVGLIIAAGILLSIDPLLVILALAGGLPRYITARKYAIKLFQTYVNETDDLRVVNDRRSFFVDPKKLVDVILFKLSNRFRGEAARIYDDHNRKRIAVGARKAWAEFVQEFLSGATLLVAIGIMVFQVLQGELLTGALVLAFTTYRAFTDSTNSFFAYTSHLEDGARYAAYWFDLFSLKPLVSSAPGAKKPIWDTPPRIEYQNVSFSYPGNTAPVLKDISFVIDPGAKVALVGLNGAGKTTLIKLLARVYDPNEGRILVNGIDLRDIDLDHWHRHLGILFQDFPNFQMTAREAIAITKPDLAIDEAAVAKAAEDSGAIDFIKDFPKGFDQLVWKGFQDGVELSKGQHQRMAVARILYRDALVSVLDEPTSAIDAVTEEKIFEVLERKMQGRTVVLISHRFSTVKNADVILVVEHGAITESGSHQTLMSLGGRYHELYHMQANRYLS